MGREEDYPRVFPWEARELREKARGIGVELEFRPELVYLDKESGVYVVLLYRWVIGIKCPFNIDGRCSIHGSHPTTCRMYPLIVNYSDKTLRVSLQCRWIRDNFRFIERGIDPSKVFPEEFREAVKAYALIDQMISYAEERGWIRVSGEALEEGRIIDYDEYVSQERR